jgi:hypothetical protein
MSRVKFAAAWKFNVYIYIHCPEQTFVTPGKDVEHHFLKLKLGGKLLGIEPSRRRICQKNQYILFCGDQTLVTPGKEG